jgi:hypothetical protein
VASRCERHDEPSGSCVTELVIGIYKTTYILSDRLFVNPLPVFLQVPILHALLLFS